jgi:hypothetical protein
VDGGSFGSLTVSGAGGADSVTLDDLAVTRGVNLALGAGANQVLMAATTASGSASTIGWDLRIRTAGGSDTIHLGLAARLNVGLGAGIITGGAVDAADTLTIDNAHFGGAVSVATGGGGDLVVIDGFDTATLATVSVGGPLRVDAGAGNDTLLVGSAGNPYRRLTVTRPPVLIGGAGDVDRVVVSNLLGPAGSTPTPANLAAAGWEDLD